MCTGKTSPLEMAGQHVKRVSVSESAALLVYPVHFDRSKVVIALPGIALRSGRADVAEWGGQRERAWPGGSCGRGRRELPVKLPWSDSRQPPQSQTGKQATKALGSSEMF